MEKLQHQTQAHDISRLNPGEQVWVTDMKEKDTGTAKAGAPQSYLIETPGGILHHNCSHLITLPDTNPDTEEQQTLISPEDKINNPVSV